MEKIAVMTDSNSGLTMEEAEKYHIELFPMTFFVGGKEYTEGISLTEKDFFDSMRRGESVSTTQPSLAALAERWDQLLESCDRVIHIPMSRALSGSYASAQMLSGDYGGKVLVADCQRISVTQASAAIYAKRLAEEGKTAEEIKEVLEKMALEASIYITVDTLEYLKKGGRIRSIEALAGEILNIRPVIQIKGGLLEPYCKVRGHKKARKVMEEIILQDGQALSEKHGREKMEVYIAHADAEEEAFAWKETIRRLFPGKEVHVAKLPLSVCCHVGPGTLGVGVCVSEI